MSSEYQSNLMKAFPPVLVDTLECQSGALTSSWVDVIGQLVSALVAVREVVLPRTLLNLRVVRAQRDGLRSAVGHFDAQARRVLGPRDIFQRYGEAALGFGLVEFARPTGRRVGQDVSAILADLLDGIAIHGDERPRCRQQPSHRCLTR